MGHAASSEAATRGHSIADFMPTRLSMGVGAWPAIREVSFDKLCRARCSFAGMIQLFEGAGSIQTTHQAGSGDNIALLLLEVTLFRRQECNAPGGGTFVLNELAA